MDMTRISAFLARVEGPVQVRGYIPCYKIGGGTANYRGGPDPQSYQAMGASGVTIATGCDLGQTDEKTLLAYGLSRDIAKIFRPYYGKKRHKAIEALYRAPLAISGAHAKELNLAVHKGYLDAWVRPAWEKAARVHDPSASFDALPPQAQDVIMSVCFQKGCGGVARDWPKLWGYLTTRDWRRASEELNNGFRQYVSRRKTEGAHLRVLC